MSEINQTEGLVRGADGVLYNVSPETCEPVPEIRGDTLMAGAKGTGLGPCEFADHAAARQLVDPGDHLAARQLVDPGDHAAARQLVEPGDHVAARQLVEPGDHATARQYVEPDGHAAGRKYVKYVEPDDQVAVRAQ